jgi:hypothetical protein
MKPLDSSVMLKRLSAHAIGLATMETAKVAPSAAAMGFKLTFLFI